MESQENENYVTPFDSHLFHCIVLQDVGEGMGAFGPWIRYLCNTEAKLKPYLQYIFSREKRKAMSPFTAVVWRKKRHYWSCVCNCWVWNRCETWADDCRFTAGRAAIRSSRKQGLVNTKTTCDWTIQTHTIHYPHNLFLGLYSCYFCCSFSLFVSDSLIQIVKILTQMNYFWQSN